MKPLRQTGPISQDNQQMKLALTHWNPIKCPLI